MTKNENTNQIVMKVAEELKVGLTENDISTSIAFSAVRSRKIKTPETDQIITLL